MTGVEPSVSANPLITPCSTSPPSPLLESPLTKAFLKSCPFPYKFDCVKIEVWLHTVKSWLVVFQDISAIVREAGHTNPDHLQCIQALIVAAGLPPPPSFSPPLPHSLVGIDMVFRLSP